MSADPAVEVNALSFTYPGADGPTLVDLTFSVCPGSIYGFLGPSGAGKSTTQKILYRLLAEYSGSVRVAGTEIRDWSSAVYSLMGIGFETPNLYTRLTGRENLEFASAIRKTAARKPAGQALPTIDEAARRLGMHDALDGRVETYSKGMRMRLAFIRAILHGPSLLFLDEPTSGLDPLWARRVKDWILEIRESGAAVFLTTHSMELADELCDTVGFLVDGRLVAQDSPAALKQQHGRSGVTVTGISSDGRRTEVDYAYQELLQGPIVGFERITRIVNREVTLEQVFLALTGRSLAAGTT
ncbi:MAG: ABC transporter ATP-binding protein [Spirochaetaceae bacterium]|nr:MAG: ABC transporter ATP-binding protein [Spirochaetaceae bacterium]